MIRRRFDCIMLAYLKKSSHLEKWYIVRKEDGGDLYLHPDGTWSPTTRAPEQNSNPGLYLSQEEAGLIASEVFPFAVVFQREGETGPPSKAFADAEAPSLAMEVFLAQFFGPGKKVLNPPPPLWAEVYFAEDAVILPSSNLLLRWRLSDNKK